MDSSNRQHSRTRQKNKKQLESVIHVILSSRGISEIHNNLTA